MLLLAHICLHTANTTQSHHEEVARIDFHPTLNDISGLLYWFIVFFNVSLAILLAVVDVGDIWPIYFNPSSCTRTTCSSLIIFRYTFFPFVEVTTLVLSSLSSKCKPSKINSCCSLDVSNAFFF